MHRLNHPAPYLQKHSYNFVVWLSLQCGLKGWCTAFARSLAFEGAQRHRKEGRGVRQQCGCMLTAAFFFRNMTLVTLELPLQALLQGGGFMVRGGCRVGVGLDK